MELKELERYYLCNILGQLDVCHHKDIGLAIAMLKFEEFQRTFIYAQHSFLLGMKEEHKVSAGDGNNERAKKGYRFYHLRHAILDFNACYDFILQIVYFGCDFFDEIKSSENYANELEKCKWITIKRKTQELSGRSEMLEKLKAFYDGRGNYKKANHPLTYWTNQIKHRGGFIINELVDDSGKIEITNQKTGEIIFSSDYIKPICVSFQEIKNCLVYHNDKIVEYAEFLYISLGLDNPCYLKREFSATQRIDTTDCIIKCKF